MKSWFTDYQMRHFVNVTPEVKIIFIGKDYFSVKSLIFSQASFSPFSEETSNGHEASVFWLIAVYKLSYLGLWFKFLRKYMWEMFKYCERWCPLKLQQQYFSLSALYKHKYEPARQISIGVANPLHKFIHKLHCATL